MKKTIVKLGMCVLGVLGMVLPLDFSAVLYAQETIDTYRPSSETTFASEEECMRDFDIDKVPGPVGDNAHLLYDYFQCRNSLDEGIINSLFVRTGLTDSRRYFNQHFEYLGALATSLRPTPRLLKQCKESSGIPKSDCRGFIKAFILNDVEFCGKDKTCRGYITLDEGVVRGDDDKQAVRYLKAITDLDIKQCAKVSDKLGNRMCRAYITQDNKICEKYAGFKEFKKKYCKKNMRDKRKFLNKTKRGKK